MIYKFVTMSELMELGALYSEDVDLEEHDQLLPSLDHLENDTAQARKTSTMKHEVNQTEFIVSLNTLSWDKAMEQDTPEATLDDPQYSTHDQPLVIQPIMDAESWQHSGSGITERGETQSYSLESNINDTEKASGYTAASTESKPILPVFTVPLPQELDLVNNAWQFHGSENDPSPCSNDQKVQKPMIRIVNIIPDNAEINWSQNDIVMENSDSSSTMINGDNKDKVFNQLSHKTVVKQEVNIYRYGCGVCYESFVQEGQLTDHLKEKHPHAKSLLYRCPSCESCFYTMRKLQGHSCDIVCQYDHTAGKQRPAGRIKMPINHFLECYSSSSVERFESPLESPVNLQYSNDSRQSTDPVGNTDTVSSHDADFSKDIQMTGSHANTLDNTFSRTDLIFGCGLCFAKFIHNYQLLDHMKREHPFANSPSFQCTECKICFASNSSLYGHVYRNHQFYQCPTCNSWFKGEELYKHLTMVGGDVRCQGGKFPSPFENDAVKVETVKSNAPRSSLVIKLENISHTHMFDIESDCQNSGEAGQPSLIQVERCFQCDRWIIGKEEFALHNLSCIGNNIDAEKCSRCHFWILGMNEIINHGRRCSGNRSQPVRQYTCHRCFKSFVRRAYFEMHMRNLSCSEMKLPEENVLKCREKTKHKGFTCLRCSMFFTEKALFTKHKQWCYNETLKNSVKGKRFHCKYCNKPFFSEKSFQHHQTTTCPFLIQSEKDCYRKVYKTKGSHHRNNSLHNEGAQNTCEKLVDSVNNPKLSADNGYYQQEAIEIIKAEGEKPKKIPGNLMGEITETSVILCDKPNDSSPTHSESITKHAVNVDNEEDMEVIHKENELPQKDTVHQGGDETPSVSGNKPNLNSPHNSEKQVDSPDPADYIYHQQAEDVIETENKASMKAPTNQLVEKTSILNSLESSSQQQEIMEQSHATAAKEHLSSLSSDKKDIPANSVYCMHCDNTLISGELFDLHYFSAHAHTPGKMVIKTLEMDEKSPKLFRCMKCKVMDVGFDVEQLRHHISVEHNKIHTLKCNLCNCATGDFQHLLAHVIAQHPESSRAMCNVCTQNYPSMIMSAHKLSSHELLECNLCKSDINVYHWGNHMISKHKVKTYYCGICRSTFHTIDDFRKHMEFVKISREQVPLGIETSMQQAYGMPWHVVSKRSKSIEDKKPKKAKSKRFTCVACKGRFTSFNYIFCNKKCKGCDEYS